MKKPHPRRIGLSITGASGAVYGLRLLEELLRADGVEVHLTISPSAQKVLKIEHGIVVDLQKFDAAALKISNAEKLHYHPYDDVAAPPASGSFRMEALAIVPCSM